MEKIKLNHYLEFLHSFYRSSVLFLDADPIKRKPNISCFSVIEGRGTVPCSLSSPALFDHLAVFCIRGYIRSYGDDGEGVP